MKNKSFGVAQSVGRLARVVVIILVAQLFISVPSFASPEVLRQAVTKFFVQALSPVVGEKRANMKYRVFSKGEDVLLIVEGHYNGIPLSHYTFHFNNETQKFAIPNLQFETKHTPSRQAFAQVNGEVIISARKVLDSTDLEDEKALVRLLLRADPVLLPQLTLPGLSAPEKVTLTDPQQTLLTEVKASLSQQKSQGISPRALIFLPTGIGKTILAALTLEKREQQIFFVVENKEVLRDATDKFIRLLNIPRSETAVLTDQYEGSKIEAIKSKKVVAITRTGLHNALEEFAEHLDRRKNPAVFIFDEAQHLGRKEGQFEKIIATVEKHLRPDDLILGLSATPWHTETDFVQRFFARAIFSVFLTPEEKERVLQNRDLVQLAMTSTLRAMAAGYLNPIFAYDEVSTVPGLEDVSVRDLLNRDEMAFNRMSNEEATEQLRKQISVHQPLLLKMIHEIVNSLDRSDQHTYYWNRGLIFVPSIAHANVYSFMLNRLRKEVSPGIPIEFDAYHSKLPADESDRVMDWFKDEQVRGSKKVHKYMIVVRSAGEGFDYPAINHLITAKPYNREDQIGVRELLQNLGRATRLAAFKTKLRVTDFTGDMRRLFSDLDSNVLRAFPAVESTLKTKPPARTTEVVLDHGSPGVEQLTTQTVDVSSNVAGIAEPAVADTPPPEQNWTRHSLPPVSAEFQAALEKHGAKDPIEYIANHLDLFDWFYVDPKSLEELNKLHPELAPHFREFIQRVAEKRVALRSPGANLDFFVRSIRVLKLLRDREDGKSFLFKREHPLTDAEFAKFYAAFGLKEFEEVMPVQAHMERMLTEKGIFSSASDIGIYIPVKYSSDADQYRTYVRERVLSPFQKNTLSKRAWIKVPLADWPFDWRSGNRRLASEPGTLTNAASEASATAHILTLQDFLTHYYNEAFEQTLTEFYEGLVRERSDLLVYRYKQAGFSAGFFNEEFFLELQKGTDTATLISLYIFAKAKGNRKVQAGVYSTEFSRIHFLISELIARCKMLGINSYLTSAQVEQLMSSNHLKTVLPVMPPEVKEEIEKLGAKSPLDFMARNPEIFDFRFLTTTEEITEKLRFKLSPTLHAFFPFYLRQLGTWGRDEFNRHKFYYVMKGVEALATLRTQNEEPLSDTAFARLDMPFGEDQLEETTGLKTFVNTIAREPSANRRQEMYLSNARARLMFIPQSSLKEVDLVRKFVREQAFGPLGDQSKLLSDWLKLPIEHWPLDWRSQNRRLVSNTGFLSAPVKEASELAGIRNLSDFLTRYYNEDFTKAYPQFFESFIENHGGLLFHRDPNFRHDLGFLTSSNSDVFFLNFVDRPNRTANLIALSIYMNQKTKGEKDLLSKEFESLYFLINEMIHRCKILGINSHLTHAQVEILNGEREASLPEPVTPPLKNPLEFIAQNIAAMNESLFVTGTAQRMQALGQHFPHGIATQLNDYITGRVSDSNIYKANGWRNFIEAVDLLAELKNPASRAAYLFGSESPLPAQEFATFDADFTKSDFERYTNLARILYGLNRDLTGSPTQTRQREIWGEARKQGLIYLPLVHFKDPGKLTHYVQTLVLDNPFYNMGRGRKKIDWINKPIADWPMTWRSSQKDLIYYNGVLVSHIGNAANKAGIQTLNDFLVKYYNEDFVQTFTDTYEKLVEENLGLLVHGWVGVEPIGFGRSIKERFFLDSSFDRIRPDRTATLIALHIFVKSESNGNLLSKEFEALYDLVHELIQRSKMLGIKNYLTHDQAEKLKTMGSCEIFARKPM